MSKSLNNRLRNLLLFQMAFKVGDNARSIEHRGLDESSLNFLKGLLNNPSLSKNQKELRNIISFVSKAKTNEKRWENECKSLNSTLETNRKKTDAANVRSKEDQKMIESLKTQLEQYWQKTDEAFDKEERAIAKIAYLKSQLLKLKNQVEIKNGSDVQDILNDHNQLQKENRELMDRLNECGEQIRLKNEAEKYWKRERDDFLKEAAVNAQQMQATKEKLNSEVKKKTNYEKEVKRLKSEESQSKKSRTSNNTCSSSSLFSSSRLQKQLTSKIKELDKMQKELENYKLQLDGLEMELKNKDKIITNLEEESELKNAKLVSVEKEAESKNLMIENIKKDVEDSVRKNQNENLAKDLVDVNRKYLYLKKESEMLREKCNSQTLLLQKTEGQKEAIEKQSHELQHEITNLRKQLERIDKENECLSKIITNSSKEIKKQTVLIEQMDVSRDRYVNDMGVLHEEIQSLQERIKGLVYLLSKSQEIPSLNNEDLDISFNHETEIESLKVNLRSKEQEISLLQDTVEHLRETMQDMAVMTERKSTETITCSGNIDDHAGIGDSQSTAIVEAVKAEQKKWQKDIHAVEEKSKLLENNMELTSKMVILLKDKLSIKDEVLRRENVLVRANVAEIKNLKDDIETLKETFHRLNEKEKYFDSDDPALESTSQGDELRKVEKNTDIDELKEQLNDLQDTLAEKTQELNEKTERLNGQFEVIELLRQCISNSSTPTLVPKVISKACNSKDDTIKCLREKVILYETYIRDYQEELRNLYAKHENTTRLLNTQDLLMGRQNVAANLLQTRKIKLIPREKKR